MVSTQQAYQSSNAHNGRINYLISLGFSELSDELKRELSDLVDADADAWRAEVSRRLRCDFEAGRFTKRAVASSMGVHESYISRVLAEPHKMSERFLGLLSLAVPGYGDVYLELRRRLDRLYLPAGPDTRDAVARNAARLRDLNRAIQEQLPAAMAALERLKELSKKDGPGDG